MRWGPVLLLALASCGDEPPDVIAIRPHLSCEHRVSCHVLAWHIGIRRGGAYIGGSHLWCRCRPPAKEDRDE